MNSTVDRLTYTVEEMGKALGISRVKAYEIANSKDFPKIRIGKRIVIPIDSLYKWLESKSISA